jgi:hypothetical protein
MFRVAEREIESWLLANRHSFATFLDVPVARIPERPDLEIDPKNRVVQLARMSRSRRIREDMVPEPGSGRNIGPDYVGRLIEFAVNTWDIDDAAGRSFSLRRAVTALSAYHPVLPWQQHP